MATKSEVWILAFELPYRAAVAARFPWCVPHLRTIREYSKSLHSAKIALFNNLAAALFAALAEPKVENCLPKIDLILRLPKKIPPKCD